MMTNTQNRNSKNLTDVELAFQSNPENWRRGPTFHIQFFVSDSFDFINFENAVLSDPLCINDTRFKSPGRVLLQDEHWSNIVGARYVDFPYPAYPDPPRQLNIMIHPVQYRRMLDDKLMHYCDSVLLAQFLDPLISFAVRMKDLLEAKEVLLWAQDFYPRKSPETELFPNIFLSELIFEIYNSARSEP